MNINSFCNKIRGLFLTLNNPFFFLYRVSHYLNRYIPRRLANYIKRKNNLNYKKSGVKDFQIETYDGSGQAVHPDIVFFENQY